MDKETLLGKWLADELTNTEQNEFEKLEDYELNKKIINEALKFKAPPFLPEKSYAELKDKIEKRDNTRVVSMASLKTWFTIAAVFLIFFSFFSLYRYNSFTTIETAAAQKSTIELPDASVVKLNVVSKITYSKYRWKNKREVKFEGEAFFEIAHGSKFDVISPTGTISILGTKFNVKSRDEYFEVKCYEGLVKINRNGETHQLEAGKTYRVVNNIVLLEVIETTVPDWLRNFSSFKGVRLFEVLNEMERQYNINIITRGVDTNRLFTGSFINNNLEQALLSVTVPFNLSFNLNDGNKITLFKSE